MAETIKIPGELESTATGNKVADVANIKDKTKGNKTQFQINAEVEEAIGADNIPGSIKGRIKENETALAENGSVDQRIAEEGAKHYLKTETYNKTELNSMITTPNQGYVTVTATDQTTAATDVLPATGSADKVYRVGNWDGTQYDETCYSEYAWNGSAYVHLSTKTQIGEVFDISAYHATGGTLATYADLAAALDSNNGGGVPQSLRKGGMSVKYVHTSDNKYVQARCIADEFTTDVTQWQGVDEELTQNSKNLIESGAVAKVIGIPIQLGTDVAKTIPYEIVAGKTYYFRNNKPANTGYVPVYTRETENGANVLLFNLPSGQTKKYVADTNYHYIRCTASKQPDGVSNYEVFEGESINGELQKHDDIINQHTTEIQALQQNKARICIDEIALEQGTISSDNGNNQTNAKRIRSINYLYGGYNITLPSGFNIFLVTYYDKTDNSYVGHKRPLVPNYTVLSTLTKDEVEHTVKARVVITKTDDTQVITPEDIKKSFAIEELYSKTKSNETNITSLGNRVTSVETKANNTADIVKNIQICETAGTATANAPCIMLAGHTYKVTNTSDNHYNYFMVYARETATSDNIPVTTSSLGWGRSVMFTPEVNCQFIRMTAGYQSNPCKVDVEDVSTHEYRITQLENWKPTVDNNLAQLDAKLNVTKHIYLGDIQYNLNTCSGWVRGGVPAPLYAEQLYDALVAAYSGYITKIDCKTDSGIEVPAYYSNTIKDDHGNYLTLPFPMYHFKPISYGDSLVKVFLTGGVHGEAIGVNSLYHFCKVLCEEATEDVKKLKYGIELYVMPYCNPSTPFIQQREYEWEGQTMHPNTSGRLNWNLVNINRNMPTSGWTLTDQYTDTGLPNKDYSGPTAGSEYESQVIMHYANLIQPDIYMDCHNSPYIVDGNDNVSLIWILRNATNSYISRITKRVSEDVSPRISKMIQASDANFPTDNMLKLVLIEGEPVGKAIVQNWFAETFNIPTYTTEGVERFPYNNGVVIPIADRTNDVKDPRFTRYEELGIESIIKRTIQELYC